MRFTPPRGVELDGVDVHLTIGLDTDHSRVSRQLGNHLARCRRGHSRDNAVAVDHAAAELLNQSGIGLSVEHHKDAGPWLRRRAESDVRCRFRRSRLQPASSDH